MLSFFLFATNYNLYFVGNINSPFTRRNPCKGGLSHFHRKTGYIYICESCIFHKCWKKAEGMFSFWLSTAGKIIQPVNRYRFRFQFCRHLLGSKICYIKFPWKFNLFKENISCLFIEGSAPCCLLCYYSKYTLNTIKLNMEYNSKQVSKYIIKKNLWI